MNLAAMIHELEQERHTIAEAIANLRRLHHETRQSHDPQGQCEEREANQAEVEARMADADAGEGE